MGGLRRKICSMGKEKEKEKKKVGPANDSRRDVKNEVKDEISSLEILLHKKREHSQPIGRPR